MAEGGVTCRGTQLEGITSHCLNYKHLFLCQHKTNALLSACINRSTHFLYTWVIFNCIVKGQNLLIATYEGQCLHFDRKEL